MPDQPKRTFADGSYVVRDHYTGRWHAHPRAGRVLKDDATGLAFPYPTAEAAVAGLREFGYAKGAIR